MNEVKPLDADGPAAIVEPTIIAQLGGDGKLKRGGYAWAIHQGGRDPFIILVTIYIFMPYVASVLVGDPVRGQATISSWDQIIGWVVVFSAPFLGASIDKLGPRKPWLGLIVSLMVPMIAALWFGRPGGAMTLTMLAALYIGARLLFVYGEVLHNSMLVRATGLAAAHKASALALSLGNAASVLALGFTAWAFALPGKVPWGWVPAAPLFGLDPLTHEPERVVTLMAAGLLALGSIPLFLFTPDAQRTGVPALKALRDGAGELWRMLKTVRRYRDAVVYLMSRMFFVDGMNAVLIYAGVYAIGVMKWGPLEMLAYGIMLSVFAVIGGFVARWLDGAVGPKVALRIQIAVTAVSLTLMLGVAPDRILYLWPYDATAHAPLWSGPVFRHLPDWVFIGLGFVNAIVITGQYASSRTLLTRLTPAEQTGAFFGVYALSGVATLWLAPTLVNLGTNLTHTQQGGFASIIVLLVIGLIGLMFVRGGGRELRRAH
ncbi:MFS transporter [Phenylobacterium sp.]|uniref:MFS transporter n=1 Tax=Phenylobacterium sp. TaxID=1871053 RepID=UPI002F3F441D